LTGTSSQHIPCAFATDHARNACAGACVPGCLSPRQSFSGCSILPKILKSMATWFKARPKGSIRQIRANRPDMPDFGVAAHGGRVSIALESDLELRIPADCLRKEASHPQLLEPRKSS